MLAKIQWSKVLHGLESTIIGGMALALWFLHRIPTDGMVGVLAGLGGFWSGVGGVAKLSSLGSAATSSTPSALAVTAPPAPVAAAGFGAGLGPEHGAPPNPTA